MPSPISARVADTDPPSITLRLAICRSKPPRLVSLLMTHVARASPTFSCDATAHALVNDFPSGKHRSESSRPFSGLLSSLVLMHLPE